VAPRNSRVVDLACHAGDVMGEANGNGYMRLPRHVTSHDILNARDKALQQLRRIRGLREQALRERGSGSLVMRLDGLLTSNRELAQYLGATEAEIERILP
jgi:hypothetical protein